MDFSVCSRNVAQHAFDVARAIGGTVTLLHVLEAHEAEPAAHTLLQELSLLARRPPNCLIVPARSGFSPHDPGSEGLQEKVVLVGGVVLSILMVADQLDAELIVIGLHGQGNAAAGTLGQVVHGVLLNARIPVQVVRYSSSRLVSKRWSGVEAPHS
nr:universal stress protein [Deinococcus alpinitundrae]